MVLGVELRHQFVVRFRVFTLKVLHLTAAFANFLDKTTTGGVILLVCLQVLDKLIDLGTQESDLNLRRSSVVGVGLKLLNQLLLLCCLQHEIFCRTIVCFGADKATKHTIGFASIEEGPRYRRSAIRISAICIQKLSSFVKNR